MESEEVRLSHLLGDFINDINDDELDETLKELLLVGQDARADRVARLKRRLNNEYNEADFIVSSSEDASKVKQDRDRALRTFMRSFRQVHGIELKKKSRKKAKEQEKEALGLEANAEGNKSDSDSVSDTTSDKSNAKSPARRRTRGLSIADEIQQSAFRSSMSLSDTAEGQLNTNVGNGRLQTPPPPTMPMLTGASALAVNKSLPNPPQNRNVIIALKDAQGNVYKLPAAIANSWKATSEEEEVEFINSVIEEHSDKNQQTTNKYLAQRNKATEDQVSTRRGAYFSNLLLKQKKEREDIISRRAAEKAANEVLQAQANAKSYENIDANSLYQTQMLQQFFPYTAQANTVPQTNASVLNPNALPYYASPYINPYLLPNQHAVGYPPAAGNIVNTNNAPPNNNVNNNNNVKQRDLSKSVGGWKVKFAGKGQNVDDF